MSREFCNPWISFQHPAKHGAAAGTVVTVIAHVFFLASLRGAVRDGPRPELNEKA
jgi:hypothetical protein